MQQQKIRSRNLSIEELLEEKTFHNTPIEKPKRKIGKLSNLELLQVLPF